MFQTKLRLAFILLMALEIAIAAVLFVGGHEAERHLQRNELADETLLAYKRLSLDAYRYFKQLADVLVVGPGGPEGDHQGIAGLRRELEEDLERLEHATAAEVEYALGTAAEPTERAELDRIARVRALIGQAEGGFARATALRLAGHANEAWRYLTAVLEETIDRDFEAVIDEALTAERGGRAAARAHLQGVRDRLAALVLLITSLSMAVVVATELWLMRSFRRPIEQLLQGTREIAAGELGHRIGLIGRSEFADLARSFDRMAEELEHHRANLEHQVAQRTDELRQANGVLQHIDEQRREFFADISHALRTPLTVLRGEAELALRLPPGREPTGADDACRTALQRVVDLAAQMSELVNNLLLLARTEAGEPSYRLGPLALEPLLAEICEDVEVLGADRGLAVSASLKGDGGGVPIRGDAQRLRELLLILADNACRYTDPGGRITMTLGEEGGEAVVTVADSGVGIPPEELDHVFERFHRGAEGRRRAPEGAGLGLAVARSIVEAHGGGIAVASRRGEGTRVTVRLPRAVSQPVEPLHARLAG